MSLPTPNCAADPSRAGPVLHFTNIRTTNRCGAMTGALKDSPLHKRLRRQVKYGFRCRHDGPRGRRRNLHPASTARALSGAAAIVAGSRAEFNQNYFANRTIQVLAQGFDTRRDRLYNKIIDRQKFDLSQYPVEAAVKDAVQYHTQCSLIAGLQEAAISIDRANNPGFDQLNETLRKSETTRARVEVTRAREAYVSTAGDVAAREKALEQAELRAKEVGLTDPVEKARRERDRVAAKGALDRAQQEFARRKAIIDLIKLEAPESLEEEEEAQTEEEEGAGGDQEGEEDAEVEAERLPPPSGTGG